MSPASHKFLDAVAAHRAGDMDQAVRLYREVPADDPNYAGAIFNLAALFGTQGKLDDAASLYRQVLRNQPDDADALSNLGNLLQKQGRSDEAEQLYRQALEIDPCLVAAHVNLGLLNAGTGRIAEAEMHYRAALDAEPEMLPAHLNLGVLLHGLGRNDEARACFERALALDADSADAHRNLASLLLAAGDLDGAARHAEQALTLQPESAQALHQLGIVAAKRGRHEDAAEAFRRALAIRPDRLESWQELGIVLGALDRFEEAEQAFEAARRLEADNAITEFNFGNLYLRQKKLKLACTAYRRAYELAPWVPEIMLGLAIGLHETGEHDSALEIVDRVLATAPDFVEALNTRGICLAALDRHEEALNAYGRVLELSPGFTVAQYNLGNSLRLLNRIEEAAEIFRRVLDADPQIANAHSGLGLVLQHQGRHVEAIEAFDAALEIKPDFADALNNKAVSLQTLGRFSDAVAIYNQLLELCPDRSFIYFNMGGLLQLLERWDEAATVFKKGLEVDPGCAVIYPYLVHSLQQQCSWTNLAAIVERVRENTERELAANGRVSITPFALQSLPGELSMALRQRVAERTSEQIAQTANDLRAQLTFTYPKGPKRKKLRIGYISPDFRFHSVAVSFQGIIDNHDRDDFSFHAYSLHGGRSDPLNQHFRQVFDSFTDIFPMGTQEAVERIHADRIDILVDLAGHTRGMRPEILSLRPAPIQVHYLGYSATIGAKFLDYLITDHRQAPAEQRRFFTENLVYLPDVFMAGRRAEIDPSPTNRAAWGLPEQGFVFANFNNHYKFEPHSFSIWMRLLRRLPGSVLWLLKGTERSRENLRKEAAARGVEPGRLVFAQTEPHARHLARLRLADLAIDNRYHGGGITTIDALWAGVPVLTVAGDTPQSRNGASLLHAVGLEDLITHSLDDYERLAMQLAQDPAVMADVRRRLASNRESHALFDMPRLTRHLERAYRMMWERYVDGMPPSMIDVPPIEHDAANAGTILEPELLNQSMPG